MKKILVVEDDGDISQTLTQFLEESEIHSDVAYDGLQAIELFNRNDYACIVLDLMLPRRNGIEVLTHIRKTSHIPVIIMSAKDTEYDITIALDLGADDYITKPFSFGELVARIRSTVRRHTQYNVQENDSQIITFKDLVMDLSGHILKRGETEIKLTGTEFEILKLFLKHPQRVYTKEDVYKAVWKEDYYGDENIVNVHMSRLRDKIETDPKAPDYIETLWGIGYRSKSEKTDV